MEFTADGNKVYRMGPCRAWVATVESDKLAHRITDALNQHADLLERVAWEGIQV